MDKKYILPQSASSRFFFSLIIVLISFVLFYSLGIVLVALIYSIPVSSIGQLLVNVDNPRNIEILKVLQVVQSLGVFIIPPFIIARLFSSNTPAYLGLDKKIETRRLLIALLLMVATVPIVNMLAGLNEKLPLPGNLIQLEEEAQHLMEAFIRTKTLGGILINLFVIAILPAIGEELLFRGIIQKQLTEWFKNPHYAIIVASIIFSAIHFQFLGFIPRFALGMLLGYLYFYGSNLWMPIIAHFMNNAAVIMIYHYSKTEQTKSFFETVGTDASIYWALPFSVLIAVLLFLKYRQMKTEDAMLKN